VAHFQYKNIMIPLIQLRKNAFGHRRRDPKAAHFFNSRIYTFYLQYFGLIIVWNTYELTLVYDPLGQGDIPGVRIQVAM